MTHSPVTHIFTLFRNLWSSTQLTQFDDDIKFFIHLYAPKRHGKGAGMAHSPPTAVDWVRYPDLAPHVGWVCCWFSSLLRGFFSRPAGFSQAVRFFCRSSVFPPSTKPTYQISNSTWKQWTREPPRGMPTAYFPLISHWMSVIIFNYFTKHVIEVDENPKTSIKLLVCYGVGVWVSVWKQPSIKLFHSETLKHVQDISIASPVTNMQRG